MKTFLPIAFIVLMMLLGTRRISSVEVRGNWVRLYDESGRQYKTLSVSTVGEVMGYSSTFFISRNGSWIHLFDSDGRNYKTMSVSTVGDVTGVAGDTFISRNGTWIYTWDKNGKKINTRSAK